MILNKTKKKLYKKWISTLKAMKQKQRKNFKNINRKLKSK